MHILHLKFIKSVSTFNSYQYVLNKTKMDILDNELDNVRNQTYNGWGEKYKNRLHTQYRLTAWERIEFISDSKTQILSLASFVNHLDVFDKNKKSPSAGVITVITKISGFLSIIIANDNSVASGAWWPRTPEKIIRVQEIALKLNLPVIYLVDCSGLFLPQQRYSFSGQYGAGKIFKMSSLLSNKGIPQISGILGDCIAGGGYMPIISDKVYMTESAYMVIAGAALIKGSKGVILQSKSIGGSHVHVNVSDCADFYVPDDLTCLEFIKKDIGYIKSSTISYYRRQDVIEPLYNINDLSYILPVNPKHTYNIYDVIARILDSSSFLPLIGSFGKEVICGIGRISGLFVGIVANVQGLVYEKHVQKLGGVLYKEGVIKLSIFSRTCNDDGIPIIWIQDVSGFDVGIKAEKIGLLSFGSSLIYTNSNNTVPMFTILLRKASGAGYYAMCGKPYDPVIQICIPLSRLAVMEGETLAVGTFRAKLDSKFNIKTKNLDEKKIIEQQMLTLANTIEKDMSPYLAANHLYVDEIIKVNEIRKYFKYFIEACYQSFSMRRIKNQRIWAINDIQNLYYFKFEKKKKTWASKNKVKNELKDTSNLSTYLSLRSPMDGIFYTKSSPEKDDFIKSGQTVSKKTTIGLLEVMKNFYPIQTNKNHELVAKTVLKSNKSFVKKGEILFLFEKKK